jgi:hypothetical protein
MDGEKIVEYARALYNAHGDKAEAEAAQKVRECEETGKTGEAEDWKAIRTAIKEMRGAKQT